MEGDVHSMLGKRWLEDESHKINKSRASFGDKDANDIIARELHSNSGNICYQINAVYRRHCVPEWQNTKHNCKLNFGAGGMRVYYSIEQNLSMRILADSFL